VTKIGKARDVVIAILTGFASLGLGWFVGAFLMAGYYKIRFDAPNFFEAVIWALMDLWPFAIVAGVFGFVVMMRRLQKDG
jgi:hypothetical protein